MTTLHDEANPIEVRGVSFAYPGAAAAEKALDAVTLTVEHRDFLGVIGPNGGGKTTLLKIILGLLSPTGGSVTVFGHTPKQARRHVGYVPQYSSVDPSVPASVLDVVLTGRLHHSSWGPIFGRKEVEPAMAALEETNVAHLAHRTIGQLSGGQRQRVLIARALASEAKLLLLDEPTNALDATSQHELTELLHRLNEKHTLVMVSHDIAFVSKHLKHVACLNRKITCCEASLLTDEVVARMYQDERPVHHHHHHCPVTDHEEAS